MQQLSDVLEKAMQVGGWWRTSRTRPKELPRCKECGNPVVVVSPEDCDGPCRVTPMPAHGLEGQRFAVCQFCARCLARLDAEYLEREAEERKRSPHVIRAKVERLRVPAMFVPGLVAGTLEDRPAMLRVAEFMGDQAHSALVLCGGLGAGKTTAAAWALWEHERGGLFATAAQIGSTSMYNEEKWERLLVQPLLVVDDFGREFLDEKQNGAKKLETLLCDRHNWKRKTILTTNLSPADLTWSRRLKERMETAGLVLDLGGTSPAVRPQGELGLADQLEKSRQ